MGSISDSYYHFSERIYISLHPIPNSSNYTLSLYIYGEGCKRTVGVIGYKLHLTLFIHGIVAC